MRILFLSQLVPYPADAGPKVRSYHVLQYLAAAGHDVTLVAFRRDTDSPEQIAHLESLCRQVFTVRMTRSRLKDAWHLGRSFLAGLPALIARDRVAAMHQLLGEIVGKQSFDIVHVDQLWMAQYALAIRKQMARQRQSAKFVLDQHNASFLIPERLAAQDSDMLRHLLLSREAQMMLRYEHEVCQSFDQVVWVTGEDCRALHEATLYAGSDHVIPICVDTEDKQPIARVGGRRVTFLGGLHWPPNAEGVTWFADQVWPMVRAAQPGAKLTIIGKDPPAGLMADRAPSSGIEVTGYVEDVTPLLAETAVFIVPLHAGGGMRVKIIDAWAWQMPIVSTTLGAEGVMSNHGENILLGDSAADFAAGVIRLLEDPTFAGIMAANGRSTAEEHYNWQTVYHRWEQVYA